VTRRGTLAPVLRAALVSPGGSCYRHCDRPIRTHRVRSGLPGDWLVRACPSGVVSVTQYAEWAKRDPTRVVGQTLRRWTVPASLVRARDLRLATRHGPELGRPAEQFLAGRTRSGRRLRVVYWRVYPFRARDGTDRRLFVCVRRTHPFPVFFAADPAIRAPPCPACTTRPKARRSH
jgi:hypothetical protein